MAFTLVKHTIDGLALLKGDDNAPVDRPVAICCGKKPAGRVLDTIGPVGAPYYVAQLSGKFAIGTEFEVSKESKRR